MMKDYKKLIEALRCNGECHDGCAYRSEEGWCDAEAKMDADAAAAIKALQAQIPKQGEWVEDDATYAGASLSNYKCSLCGKIGGTWRRGLKQDELPNFCGNCGAKMGVQE